MSTERAALLNLAGIPPESPAGSRALALIAQALAARQSPPEAITAALESGAVKYLVIGGRWELAALRHMHPFDIAVLESAGRKFMAAQALNAGYCSRGGLEEAGVAAEIDGGEALERAEIGAGSRVFGDLFQRTVEKFSPRAGG